MKRKAFAIGALGALMLLGACADTGYYGAGFGGTDTVYYDGYYGPYTDGYWGPDAFFYYRGGDGRFVRDQARHFRHDRFRGARGYHMHRDYDRRGYDRR